MMPNAQQPNYAVAGDDDLHEMVFDVKLNSAAIMPHNLKGVTALRITSDYEDISNTLLARYILVKLNFPAYPCTLSPTLVFIRAKRDRITKRILLDIFSHLGLKVEVGQEALCSAFSLSHMLLFSFYNDVLVMNDSSRVYREEERGLSLIVESNKVRSHSVNMICFSSLVLSENGTGLLFIRYKSMRRVDIMLSKAWLLSYASELLPCLNNEENQSESENKRKNSRKEDEDDMLLDLDDLFQEEAGDHYVPSETNRAITGSKNVSTPQNFAISMLGCEFNSNAAVDAAVDADADAVTGVASTYTGSAVKRKGFLLHTGNEVSLITHYAYYPSNTTKSAVSLHTDYDEKSAKEEYRLYIPTTADKYALYYQLACNINLNVINDGKNTVWNLVVIQELHVNNSYSSNVNISSGGEVRVVPVQSLCRVCVDISLEDSEKEEVDKEIEDTIKCLKHSAYIFHIQQLPSNNNSNKGNGSKENRLAVDGKPRLVKASTFKRWTSVSTSQLSSK